MSTLKVELVTTKRQRKQFLLYPWTVYRDNPHWIPPLLSDQKELVGFKSHPFYAENEGAAFLATRDGEPCGRILAIVNNAHNERFNERRGFFGFFECENNQETANGLFDAARRWLGERDIHLLRGPLNPSGNYTLGLLLDHFDMAPTFMMTYNPMYYKDLIENYGFEKAQDMYAYWGSIDMLPSINKKLQPIADQVAERYNVRIRPIDKRHFSEDVRVFLDVYNRSCVNMWGFVPMSEAEVDHTAKGLKHLIVPELAYGAEVDGRVIGAVFGLLDYNPRIKAINGRLFPFGFIRLLSFKKKIKKIRVISTNVLPEFQLLGIGMVLVGAMVPQALKWGLEEAEFSWVMESNSLSRGALEKGGAIRRQSYRIYDYEGK